MVPEEEVEEIDLGFKKVYILKYVEIDLWI
jgi:hypothetical protein